MGKSFNDDVFSNDFNLDSINGLNISKEAIEENKQNTKKIDVSKYNLEEIKKEIKETKKLEQQDLNNEIEQQREELQRLKERQQLQHYEQRLLKENNVYTKKTMIFKQEYLDIIDGLASINNMQIKDVLNQLLEHAINDLDIKIKDKALKNSKKKKTTKTNKNLF